MCSDCNQYVAGLMRQNKFLSGVVDKLASDEGQDAVSMLLGTCESAICVRIESRIESALR